MVFNSIDFSQPAVKDCHYLVAYHDSRPWVELSHLDKADNCFVFEYKAVFRAGLHLYIQHSHPDFLNVSDKNSAYKLYGEIKRDLTFYNAILSKLTLNDAHIYAMEVLSHAISCDEKLLRRLEDRIKELVEKNVT